MSIEVVLPDGRVIRTPGVPNHASGPDFMRLFLGSEGTFGIITEATMRITRLPETRLFRALLFKDVATGLEAGRRMMVDRLDPLVIRMYDPHSTASLVKRVLGYELTGAYMIIGFDGWREIADGAGSARAGDLRRARRARPRPRAGRALVESSLRLLLSAAHAAPAGDVRHRRDRGDVRQASSASITRRRRRSKGGSAHLGRRLHRPLLALVPVGREPLRPVPAEGGAGRSVEAQALHDEIWDVAVDDVARSTAA